MNQIESVFDGPDRIARTEDLAPSNGRAATGRELVNLVVTSGLAAIDGPGGAVSTVWAGAANLLQARKMNGFALEVGRRLDILIDGVVGLELAAAGADDRFIAAVESAAQAALTEHEESKIRWLANAAAMSGRWAPLSDSKQRYFLSLAMSWQLEHVAWLNIIRSDIQNWRAQRGFRNGESIGEALVAELLGTDEFATTRFHAVHADVTSANFITSDDATRFSFGESGEHSQLTQLGVEFMAFLEGRLDGLSP